MPTNLDEDHYNNGVELSYRALRQLFKFLSSSEDMMELIDRVSVRSFNLTSFIHYDDPVISKLGVKFCCFLLSFSKDLILSDLVDTDTLSRDLIQKEQITLLT